MALTKVIGSGVEGVSNSSDATAITIDSSENVAIGVTSKNSANDGSLTIGHTGITKISASASGNADELVLIGADASANVGMSIIANNANQCNIFLGDEDDTDVGGITYDHSDNSLRFTVGGFDRGRFDSSGNFLQGCSATPSTSVSGNMLRNILSAGASVFSVGNYSSSVEMIQFVNANGNVGSIDTNGSGTSYNTSSDYRLKENVVTDWDATSRLKQLKPSRFNFKADKDTTLDGFLAHEVSNVVPEAVTGTKDEVDKDGEIIPQGIDQSKLVPLLVKTIQELEARIAVLEAK